MNLETVIQEKIHALPPVKQAKVLAFVEDLEHETVEANGNGNHIENVGDAEAEKEARRLSIIGMFSSGHSDTSERVDEILAEGINKREGWSLP